MNIKIINPLLLTAVIMVGAETVHLGHLTTHEAVTPFSYGVDVPKQPHPPEIDFQGPPKLSFTVGVTSSTVITPGAGSLSIVGFTPSLD